MSRVRYTSRRADSNDDAAFRSRERNAGVGHEDQYDYIPGQRVHPDERYMQRMEAQADREGTARDEAAKHAARSAMERGSVPTSNNTTTVGPQPADNGMRGQLRTLEALRTYILAGNATVTVKSARSGTRFTYKFVRPKDAHGAHIIGGSGNTDNRPIWVSVLAGQDNEADYRFLGSIWPKDWKFATSAKSTKTLLDAPCMHGLKWLVSMLPYADDPQPLAAFARAEFWHEGKCGRCGRKLTVPASIENGIGPECATKM